MRLEWIAPARDGPRRRRQGARARMKETCGQRPRAPNCGRRSTACHDVSVTDGTPSAIPLGIWFVLFPSTLAGSAAPPAARPRVENGDSPATASTCLPMSVGPCPNSASWRSRCSSHQGAQSPDGQLSACSAATFSMASWPIGSRSARSRWSFRLTRLAGNGQVWCSRRIAWMKQRSTRCRASAAQGSTWPFSTRCESRPT